MLAYALLVLIAFSSGYYNAQAILVNVTVDDSGIASTGATIAYAPPNTWSYGPTCGYCAAKPDGEQAYNGTWQDVSWIPTTDKTKVETATLQFTGTSIRPSETVRFAQHGSVCTPGSGLFVFMIIPSTPGTDGGVHLTFTLDDQPAGTYDNLTTLEPFVYNVSVYANGSIPYGSHTFVLQNGGHSNRSSLALLDYMVYT